MTSTPKILLPGRAYFILTDSRGYDRNEKRWYTFVVRCINCRSIDKYSKELVFLDARKECSKQHTCITCEEK